MPSDPHVSITLDTTPALQKLQPVMDWLDGLHVATEDQAEQEEATR